MQTRIIVHKAFDKAELRGVLVEVSGRLVGFPADLLDNYLHMRCIRKRSAAEWMTLNFIITPSLSAWKHRMRKNSRAHRFERVTLLGDTIAPEERYTFYVRRMKDLGKEPVTFDEWLE